MRHVFIIGSKGIPANYGGFETFVDQLTANRKNGEIKYHVSCMSDNNNEFEYNEAHCFNIKVPKMGSARAVFYDMAAFAYCNRYIKKHNIQDAVVYVLACRIGPCIWHFSRRLRKLGGQYYVNPDGHEWMRSKWNKAIRTYWKNSEKMMIKHSDLVICDSTNIEKYIQKEYAKYNPNTTYIAYGADLSPSILRDDDDKLTNWYQEKKITPHEYYLVVGRFVPENNYEIMLKEFIASNTKKDLVIITNTDNREFYNELEAATHFEKDSRIKFVGTVYDKEMLKKIREMAFAYIHGHSVGGTNPSLIEALAATQLNLLFDVGFNFEVAKDCALYWNMDSNNLANLMNEAENLTDIFISEISEKSKKRVKRHFSCEFITSEYENILKK